MRYDSVALRLLCMQPTGVVFRQLKLLLVVPFRVATLLAVVAIEVIVTVRPQHDEISQHVL